MAIENVLNATTPDLVLELGRLGKWVQAVGLVVIVWIVIQIVNYYFNKKRLKMLDKFKEDIERIESKVDKLIKKSK